MNRFLSAFFLLFSFLIDNGHAQSDISQMQREIDSLKIENMQKDWNTWKEDVNNKIEKQNDRLKHEQGEIDFQLTVFQIILAIAFAVTVLFSLGFRKAAKEEMRGLQQDVREAKEDLSNTRNELNRILASVSTYENTAKVKVEGIDASLKEMGASLKELGQKDPAQKFSPAQSDKLSADIKNLENRLNENESLKSLKELYFAKGLKAREHKRWDDAVRFFSSYIDIDDSNDVAYYQRAYALAQLGRFDEALPDLNEAIRLNPNESKYWYNIAYVYFMKPMPDFDEAIRCYKKAIYLKQDDHEAWVNMALVYCKKPQPDFDEAIRCYKKAVEIKPDFGEAWNNMGLAYSEKPQPDFDEAIRCYKKAVEIKPDFGEAWNNMGLAYSEKPQPDFDEAIRCYQKAVDIKSDFDKAWYNMGFVYSEKPVPDFDEAIRCYQKAVDINQDANWAWNNLATCYERKGDSSKGEEAKQFYLKTKEFFTKAIQLAPDEQLYKNNLARVEEKLREGV